MWPKEIPLLASNLWCCLLQADTVRKREQDLQKAKKEMELLNVQHESNEQSIKKRHQEQLNEMNDQLERANKQKSKYLF